MHKLCNTGLAFFCLIGAPVLSQDFPVDTGTTVVDPEKLPEEKKKKKVNFVFAPIPIVNPTIGNGLAVAGLMLYKHDPESPASMTAVAAGYTDSDSWGVGVLQDSKFAKDRWRLKVGGAIAIARYELYLHDTAPDFHFSTEQEVRGGLAQALRRFGTHFFAGLRYQNANVLFPAPEEVQDLIPSEGLELNIAGLGLVAEWDSRNHSFQPSGGNYLTIRNNFSREDLGADLEYDTYAIALNHYRGGFRDQDVFAMRLSLCSTTHDTPFFERCQFGSSHDLRGYAVGRYYDDAMYAAQVEYRAPIWKRLGAVAFAGIGGVAHSFGDFGSGETLAAGGVGLRFLASPEQKMNVSVDFAVGKDDSTFYVYIGEAF